MLETQETFFHSSRTTFLLLSIPWRGACRGLLQGWGAMVELGGAGSPGLHFYAAGINIAAKWLVRASARLLQVPHMAVPRSRAILQSKAV